MFSIFLATNSFYLLSQVVSVFCFFVCVFVSLSSRVYASLAQWLEHWSCKPGVESSNLSWAYIAIDAQMVFQFIYSSID